MLEPVKEPSLLPLSDLPGTAGACRETDGAAAALSRRYTTVRQMSRAGFARPAFNRGLPDPVDAGRGSPTKWHLAHTSWFFETFVLADHAPGYHVFDPSFKFLFNSYYNSIGDRLARPSRGLITRPRLAEVYAYRTSVDQAMTSYLESAGDALGATVAAVIELGINHEQQHQELILTDIKHALAQNPLRPAYHEGADVSSSASTAPIDWHTHSGGLEWFGHDGAGFAFDNEGPRHRAFLAPYQLGSRLVTCGEFAAFIADGGYTRPELWLSDGWSVVSTQKWKAPLYWEKSGGEFWLMTLGGFRPLSEPEPVCHVSFYEADAHMLAFLVRCIAFLPNSSGKTR